MREASVPFAVTSVALVRRQMCELMSNALRHAAPARPDLLHVAYDVLPDSIEIHVTVGAAGLARGPSR